eukprot:1179032-Prorocentrum_minimum.AAC.2
MIRMMIGRAVGESGELDTARARKSKPYWGVRRLCFGATHSVLGAPRRRGRPASIARRGAGSRGARAASPCPPSAAASAPRSAAGSPRGPPATPPQTPSTTPNDVTRRPDPDQFGPVWSRWAGECVRALRLVQPTC